MTAAVRARSVAQAGLGLHSLIEIGSSTVVRLELADAAEERPRRALRLNAVAFVSIAAHLTVQTTEVIATGYHPGHGVIGCRDRAVMFARASGKARTGTALNNPVLRTAGG